MAEFRRVISTRESQPTLDGAGVKLKRAFGHSELSGLDPFLLLDAFGSNNPADYLAGFPWHPHRGMETVTYMLSGEVEHQDSLKNKGTILSGDLQWMTAGSGIIHQEMPKRSVGLMRGMQLWVNLPRKQKMSEPKYRDVRRRDVPEAHLGNGVTAKVIAGSLAGVHGPVDGLSAAINYFHFSLAPHKQADFSVPVLHNAFAYVLGGAGKSGNASFKEGELAVFSKGNEVSIESQDSPLEFIFASGEPLSEPIAWGGPIVMNTQGELQAAFRELDDGTFIKKKAAPS